MCDVNPEFVMLVFLSLIILTIMSMMMQVEALTNQEEVELRSKIEALGLEVTKVPSKSKKNLDEVNQMFSNICAYCITFMIKLTLELQLEIAKELDELSAKLDNVDEMISSAIAADPQVKSLLSSTADVWMPVITATTDERRNFTASIENDNLESKHKNQIVFSQYAYSGKQVEWS